MIKINWNQFKVKNKNYRATFEDLCYYLFCRKFKMTEGIRADFNQVGLETYPILYEGKHYGFQAKFFEYRVNYEKIENSIKKALSIYKGKLDVIYICTEANIKLSSPGAKNIENDAKKNGVGIEWITKSNFKVLLNKPSNLDLAQLYFGVGDEKGFIKNSFPTKISTLLQSSEYTSLLLQETIKGKVITSNKLEEEILKKGVKEILITGHPGSGKSILMYKLFQEFGGLNTNSIKEMRKVINRNKAIPMFIDLKSCASESLENLVRNRKRDFDIGRNIKFIYLLDGLDEVSEDRVDSVLSDIYRMEKDSDTKKIIVSSRSGTGNLSLLKAFNSKIPEYRISSLGIEYIDNFFKAKNDSEKINKLEKLKQDNVQILANIKDILLIKLLWDAVGKIDKDSTIFDLFSNKIQLLLSSPEHRKNLEELNLPNPKEKQVTKINEELSYNLQKKFRFSFSAAELQDLILNMFPQTTYKSVNAIVEYIAKSFFDYHDNSKQEFYAYQHRIYQEFFLAQKLKEEYYKDPAVLRTLNVLPNKSFFESLFLKYLKNIYKSENNIIGLIELGVLNDYLSRDRYWGANKLYYANSNAFMPALAYQDNSTIEKLLEDENLQLMKKITIDIGKLKKNFDIWNKDKKNFEAADYLRDMYENGIAFLIRAISVFHKQEKDQVATKLIENLGEVINLFKESKFVEYYEKDTQSQLSNPYWKELENWFYIPIVINKENIKKVFNETIKGNYKDVSNKIDFAFDESSKEKLIGSFLRVCLKYRKKELFVLTDNFDDYEFLVLLRVFSEPNFMPFFIKESSLHSKIKRFLEKYQENPARENEHILFFKKFFGISLSKKEKDYIKIRLGKIEGERPIDMRLNNNLFSYAILSYSIKKNTFKGLVKDVNRDAYYNGRILYAALFNDFVKLIQSKIKVREITRNYILYMRTHTHNINYWNINFIRSEISVLWAYIFKYSKLSPKNLLPLKNLLSREEDTMHTIDIISFAKKTGDINKNLLQKLFNESDLREEWNKIIKGNNDFHDYIDNCFQFASLFASINRQKAFSLILRGISDGILRHGYHKDVIVSYELPKALEILWRNNWMSKEDLKKYTRKIFALTQSVAEITDGKETWDGPINVIDLVAGYDILLAEMLKVILKKNTNNYYLINDAVTCVLYGKVKLGYPINDIEKEMKEYIPYYGESYERDVYEKKWKIYLSIALSDFYTQTVRKEAFNKAYSQVEEMKKQKIQYFLMDADFKKEKKEFIKLCEKFRKTPNVSIKEKKDYEIERPPLMSESKFVQEVQKSKTRKKLKGLYAKLNDYKSGIILKKKQSWDILLEETFQTFGNIQPFLELLKDNHFPGMFYYSRHSKYFPYGVAAALKKNDTKPEMESYLSENGGHDAFFNMIKVYEAKNDREMCIKLFKRYLQFCEFLVN